MESELFIRYYQKFFVLWGKKKLTPKFIEFDEPIDSSNMKKDHYFMMASILEAEYEKYDAFIILHGTDTMAYTASFLSFIC